MFFKRRGKNRIQGKCINVYHQAAKKDSLAPNSTLAQSINNNQTFNCSTSLNLR